MQEYKDIIPNLELEKARNALDEAKILFDPKSIAVRLTVHITRLSTP